MQNFGKDPFDKSIQEVFEEHVKGTPPPLLSSSEAWNRMRKEKSSPRKYYRKILIAAAVVLFAVIFTQAPQGGSAFNRFTDMYYTVQGSVIQLFGGSGNESKLAKQDDPEPEEAFYVIEDSEMLTEQMSIEEAQAVMEFPIQIPKFVPDGFQLELATVLRKEGEKGKEIYVNYINDDRGFIITELAVEDQFGFGAALDADDVDVEELMIHGQKANLISYKNSHRQLIWITQTHYFSIEGSLTKEEIIEIARSM